MGTAEGWVCVDDVAVSGIDVTYLFGILWIYEDNDQYKDGK